MFSVLGSASRLGKVLVVLEFLVHRVEGLLHRREVVLKCLLRQFHVLDLAESPTDHGDIF